MEPNSEIEKVRCEEAFLTRQENKGLQLSWKHSAKQILAACIAHSLVIHAGINMAFSAVLLPQLREDDTRNGDITINLSQGSWIASIVTASLPLGSLIIGPLMDKFGRKKMCILTTIPFLISWLLHVFADSVWHIYIARIIAGFGCGISTVGVVYVSEISHPRYRPMLLTFNSVFVTFGILLTCIFGIALHWTVMAKIFCGIAAISLVGLFYIPESPYWLVVFKNDKKGCSKALKWLYPDDKIFEDQYDKILMSAQVNRNESTRSSVLRRLKCHLEFYKKPIVWKPMLILLTIFTFQQLSSAYVIIFYALEIFRKIGGSFKFVGLIDEFVALILLGSIRFVMALVLAVISKKIARRYLMFVSGSGMILTSFSLGLYMNLMGSWNPGNRQDGFLPVLANYTLAQENQEISNNGSDGTIAVVLLLTYICFSSFGWLVIPWTLIGELLPVKTRGVLGGVLVSAVYGLMFVLVKIAPFLMEEVRMGSIFLGLGLVNLCGLLYLYKFLPETLGRTFDDIASYFDGN